MLLLDKNKKGLYLPLFVMIVPVILAALLGVMISAENDKEDFVGFRAVKILKAVDESGKINLYIDVAAEHSKANALKNMAVNGGYNSKNRCEKTARTLVDNEQYVIWNTCPVLNLEKEFETEFKQELKSLLQIYKSLYKTADYEKILGRSSQNRQDYAVFYTGNVRNASILSIERKQSEFMITISDIALPVEETADSAIILQPKTKIQIPDFFLYRKLHKTISERCINREFNDCSAEITSNFPGSEILHEDNIYKFKIPAEGLTIKFALMPESQIPSYQN